MPGLVYPTIIQLQPARTAPETKIENYTIGPKEHVDVDIHVPRGFNYVVAQIEVSYDPNAVNGIRIIILYSVDGVNYDTPAGARSLGRYIDPEVVAGRTERLTLAIPAYTDHVRIRIRNRDSDVSHTVTVRVCLARL